MIVYGRKLINELQKLTYNYIRDMEQLEEIYSCLRERCSKLPEKVEIKEVDVLIKMTENSLREIDEALHKLHEAR